MPDILDYCKGRKVETFKSGATLISEGGEDRKLFVLVEGQVEVLRTGYPGRPTSTSPARCSAK